LAAQPADDAQATLALAADAFIVRTRAGVDVVAGYPWFGAWSRDTMLSYEGLFLTTNRVAEGRELLSSYAGTLSEGMLANTGHRQRRVQHRGRHPVVPARGRPARGHHRRLRPRRPTAARPARRDRPSSQGHPVRHRRRPDRRPAPP